MSDHDKHHRKNSHFTALSRRGFLQASAIMGASSIFWSMPSGPALASKPRKGGTLTVALGSGETNDSLDPATYIGGFGQAFSFARHNCLTEIAPDGSLRPELAESWEPSADARTWLFNIRKGVEFQNGKSLNSTDVIKSIDHHRGDSGSAMKPVVDEIEDMEADGSHRVIIRLKTGNADFAFTLSDYHMVICPVIDGELDWASGIGTGPYIMDEFEPGVRAILDRNPNYWKENAAYFDRIEILPIPDSGARLNALLTGEVDLIDRVEFRHSERVQSHPNLQLEEVAGSQHYTFAMDTREPPFDDVHVRLALKHGIDRQDLVDRILHGHGEVGNDHPIGPSYRFYADDLEQRQFDPERARYHLRKAGLDGLQVTLSVSDAAFAGATDAAALYREHLAEAGIDLTLDRRPADGYWSDVWMEEPFSASFWRGRPTEDWMFSTVYATGASWNDTFWDHERFNRLLDEARVEFDEERRHELYAEMQKLIRDEGGTIVPMFANYVSASTVEVQHHDEVAASDDLDGMRFTERWWFA